MALSNYGCVSLFGEVNKVRAVSAEDSAAQDVWDELVSPDTRPSAGTDLSYLTEGQWPTGTRRFQVAFAHRPLHGLIRLNLTSTPTALLPSPQLTPTLHPAPS